MNYLTQKRFINRPKEELGEFNLAKPPFGGHATIDAWLCRDCKKIIVEY